MKYYTAEAILAMEFIQFPKWLKKYDCSSDAKLLYIYLLDRYKLSLKNRNKWVDEENRVYTICSRKDMMDLLGCQSAKAVKVARELREKGLIEEKKKGDGRCNWLYLLIPDYQKCIESEEEFQNFENQNFENQNFENQSVQNFQNQNSDYISKNNSSKNNSVPVHKNKIFDGVYVDEKYRNDIDELVRLIGTHKLKGTKKSLDKYISKLSEKDFKDSKNMPIRDLKSYVITNFKLNARTDSPEEPEEELPVYDISRNKDMSEEEFNELMALRNENKENTK